MSLNVLEGLIAGIWLGGYLFTTFVVSPALKSLPLGDAEYPHTFGYRQTLRQTGRPFAAGLARRTFVARL